MNRLVNPQYWLLKIVAFVAIISCQRTENNYGIQQQESATTLDQEALKIDLSKVPTLGVDDEAIIKKYQAIAGSEVRSIIDSIPHGEVLAGILDPETERPVPIPVCFAAQGTKELMFVPAIFLEEAALFLQAYYKARPDSDKVQIISVVQSEDWAAVAQKAGPGIAGYKDTSNVRKERIGDDGYEKLKWNEKREDKPDTDGGINDFFEFEDEPYPWVRLCRKSWMHDAVDIIPSQEEIEPNNKWSCGINSAAKAIHMFGEDMSETHFRNTFLPNAPKAFDRAKTAVILAGMGEASRRAPLFSFFGEMLGDIYLAGAVAAASMPSDVGPTPKRLAEYITGYLPGTKRAQYWSYDDFWECAEIIRDDLRRGDPVIVFWSFSPAKAHYVNVVGVSVDSNDLPEEFIIMEPNDNCLYRLSYQDMRLLMRREFASYVPVTSLDDYHIVRFYR